MGIAAYILMTQVGSGNILINFTWPKYELLPLNFDFYRRYFSFSSSVRTHPLTT